MRQRNCLDIFILKFVKVVLEIQSNNLGQEAKWSVTCAQKPRFSVRDRLLAMYGVELSAVITQLMSKCL